MNAGPFVHHLQKLIYNRSYTSIKVIKYLQETEENICDLGLDNGLLRHQNHDSQQKKHDTLEFFKTKSFCTVKDTVKRWKRQLRKRDKLFVTHIYKNCIQNMQRTLKLNNKKKSYLKWARNLNTNFTSEDR